LLIAFFKSYRVMSHFNAVPNVHIDTPVRKVPEALRLVDVYDCIVEHEYPIEGCLHIVLLVYPIHVIFFFFLQLQSSVRARIEESRNVGLKLDIALGVNGREV
jgi:hypothetical protein